MVSNKFLELTGYLRDADKWRPNVQAKLARKPFILGFVWIVAGALGLVLIYTSAYVFFQDGIIYFPLAGFAFSVFLISAVASLWAGPFGLQQKIFDEERQVRRCYYETRLKMAHLKAGENLLVMGIGPIKKGLPLTLVDRIAELTPGMLRRETIGEDLRLPLGEYTYLGIAFEAEGGAPDIAHPDLMKQLWIREALKQGFTEDEVIAFVRGLKLTTLDWS